MPSILVTGGAGYIGSHTVLTLLENGHQVVVLDNLYSGHRWAVDQRAVFVEGDIADRVLVEQLIRDHEVSAVVHFAGYVVVPESMENPLKYYQNNVVGSLNLLQSCIAGGVDQFVFSSSAAIYGSPDVIPVHEDVTKAPINPYGSSKLITEWTLADTAAASGLRYAALRYFNVAGAHVDGALGQATPAATHLIKVACETAAGKRDSMSLFGDDYDTVDGTCVRDYIHVQDLAMAHLNALDYLAGGGASIAANCGYGQGYSVRQVVDCVKQVSGVDFDARMEARRPGDPAELVADNQRILDTLEWRPRFNDLEVICRTAYEWELKLRDEGRNENC